MVIAGQVEQSVQHQHLDLNPKRMTLLNGLTPRCRYADSQVSGNLVRTHAARGKRQHIRCLVFAPKLPVESSNGCVRCQKHRHMTAQPYFCLRFAQKARQGPHRG